MQTSKNRKYILGLQCQGNMKRGEKWFSNFDLKNIRSESFSIRTSKRRAHASELVLLRGCLTSEIALQVGKTLHIGHEYDQITINIQRVQHK